MNLLRKKINSLFFQHTNNVQLIIYAEQGNLEKVQKLIELGANIHFRVDKALAVAVEKNRIDVVKFLVESGADYQDLHGFSLYFSTKHPSLEITNFLVNKGFDCSNEVYFKTVIATGDLSLVKKILSQGATLEQLIISSVYHNKLNLLQYAINQGGDIHIDNNRAISIALNHFNFEIAQYLVDNGIYFKEHIHDIIETELQICHYKNISFSENGVKIIKFFIDNSPLEEKRLVLERIPKLPINSQSVIDELNNYVNYVLLSEQVKEKSIEHSVKKKIKI